MATQQLDQTTGPVDTLERAVERCRAIGIALPTFAQLADPALIPERIQRALAAIGPDEPHPLNLFRVHWFNDRARPAWHRCPSTSSSRAS